MTYKGIKLQKVNANGLGFKQLARIFFLATGYRTHQTNNFEIDVDDKYIIMTGEKNQDDINVIIDSNDSREVEDVEIVHTSDGQDWELDNENEAYKYLRRYFKF